ncbi:MAG: aspartate-semialdehyde dehydrogenase [Alphaproteobacteria bacterium]|nr:aspartate-semialdehyde dehydrogenase [Alphaproteobacteria bacterium]
MGYHIAVVGATGNVGQEILKILEERQFPIQSITAVASRKSAGRSVSFGEDRILKCVALDTYDFKGIDIVLSSIGAKETLEFCPRATAAGAIVIDNSSAYRMDPDVPLVVPEVNMKELSGYTHKNIIANPNCVAIPLCVALSPLEAISPIKRVVVSTYQSTSGAGREAMDELYRQTRDTFMNNDLENEIFTKPIAFNVIPHIDVFHPNGQTGEEVKIATESVKILGRDILIFATSVRVPTFIGHAISATVEFEKEITEAQARDALKRAPGIELFDKRQDGGYITPLDAAREDNVYISRVRQDPSVPYGLGLWIVSDNMRKGAALNAVQIAEALVKNHLCH